MVVCGQQYGLKALRQAHLHRFWSFGTKTYSTKQVSITKWNAWKMRFFVKKQTYKFFRCYFEWNLQFISSISVLFIAFGAFYFHSWNNHHHTSTMALKQQQKLFFRVDSEFVTNIWTYLSFWFQNLFSSSCIFQLWSGNNC